MFFSLKRALFFPTKRDSTELFDSFTKQYILIALQDLRMKWKSSMGVCIKNTRHLSCTSYFILIFLDKTYKIDDPQFSSYSLSHRILFIFSPSHLHQTCLFITTPLVQTSYWRVERWVVLKQVQKDQVQQTLKKYTLWQLFRSQPTTGRLG